MLEFSTTTFQPPERPLKNTANGELIGGPCAPDTCVSSELTYNVQSEAAKPVPEPSEIVASVLASAFLLLQMKKRQKKGLKINNLIG